MRDGGVRAEACGHAAPPTLRCSHAWPGSCGAPPACTRCSPPAAPLAPGPRRRPPWPARPRGSRGWASC
eukprot:scaffold129437_cov57-Phaeocystis_antarctica.AAC.1